ncbi:hypothetical protein BJ684DRAFT_21899, partial [Piptocephalis cylindrospora]
MRFSTLMLVGIILLVSVMALPSNGLEGPSYLQRRSPRLVKIDGHFEETIGGPDRINRVLSELAPNPKKVWSLISPGGSKGHGDKSVFVSRNLKLLIEWFTRPVPGIGLNPDEKRIG